MTKRTAYSWTNDDRSRDFVIEAVNRLRNFYDTENADDIELLKPYRRCILNGSDFRAPDPHGVKVMLDVLALRADTKAAAWKAEGTEHGLLMAEELNQAARCARDCGEQLLVLFTNAAELSTEN